MGVVNTPHFQNHWKNSKSFGSYLAVHRTILRDSEKMKKNKEGILKTKKTTTHHKEKQKIIKKSSVAALPAKLHGQGPVVTIEKI